MPLAKQVIGKAPGVLAVNIDYDSKTATIGTAKNQPVAIEEILALLEENGYPAQWIEQ